MTDEDLKLELEITMRKAGITIPDDRKTAVFLGYKELRKMCALLRQPRTAAAEPSNAYSLVTLMKGQ